MPVDFSFLTNHAECDAAAAEVDFELKTYSTRDANLDLADERADRSQSSITAQLTKVNAEIATKEIIIATPGLDAKTIEDATDERDALLVRRKALLKRNRLSSGTTRFLAEVDAEQIATQVATLNSVKAGIATHRATLPA